MVWLSSSPSIGVHREREWEREREWKRERERGLRGFDFIATDHRSLPFHSLPIAGLSQNPRLEAEKVSGAGVHVTAYSSTGMQNPLHREAAALLPQTHNTVASSCYTDHTHTGTQRPMF